MAGRIIIAALISAILMFAWGFLYWGVFNVGGKILKPVPMEIETIDALKRMLPGSGMYVLPFPEDFSDQQGQILFKNRHNAGPLFRLAYQAEGAPMMPTSKMVQGFALNFVVALIAAGLVAMAGRGLPRFDSRFCFVILLSLLATVWVNVGDLIWWFHTPAYCLGNIAYGLVAGFLMAAVIGSLVKPSATATEPAKQE
jgi:hypothetical protein